MPNKGTRSSRPPRCCARRATASAPTSATWSRDEANDVEFFYLRPRGHRHLRRLRHLDLGITGRDLLVDAGSPADELLDSTFAGAARFAAA